MPAGGTSIAATLRRRELTAHLRLVLVAAAGVAAVGVALGLAFAGSPARLAEGVRVAGFDVGGLTTAQAHRQLAQRSDDLRGVPVTFVVAGRRFPLTPAQLGIRVDWAAAVEAAYHQGEGFGPLRGFRRIHTRIFGVDVAPPAQVSEQSLAYVLAQIARQVDRPAVDAALRFDGLEPVVVPAAAGRRLDRGEAEEVLVRALAGFARIPVQLPVRAQAPRVTAAALEQARRQARAAVSAPLTLVVGKARWRLTQRRLASLLLLPAGGATRLSVGGDQAARLLGRVAQLIERRPVSAGFEVRSDGTVRVVPGIYGRRLDRPATGRALLAAATSQADRVARIHTTKLAPERSTAEAKAMGITATLAVYSTYYAGSADRIHNLQLAVSLLDGTLVAPGGVFSLNEAVGERTAERGFRRAPVIIGGEYEEDIGGGVSQVATTVFNAAWEAGLKIAERNPHALYISRYPLGRDATVNYPDLDLEFVNDTKSWILVRGWSGDTGISIGLYGTPTERRVVSGAGELVVRGSPPLEKIADPELPKGQRLVEANGEPPRSVTVTRKVYLPNGDLLYDETWTTNYRGEKRIVRVGTKQPEPVTTTTTTTTAPPRTETQPGK